MCLPKVNLYHHLHVRQVVSHQCYVSVKWIGQIRATRLESSSYILYVREVAFGLSLKVLFIYSLIFFHCLLCYFSFILK